MSLFAWCPRLDSVCSGQAASHVVLSVELKTKKGGMSCYTHEVHQPDFTLLGMDTPLRHDQERFEQEHSQSV